ncbi:hypothetical protein [Kitasatospora sp. SUK 42]|uniref:hypothetical protein n=1 Tax=Kitasatospora sp. SUK 42 TaxID=1588882 RepID=UPI0018CA77BD|nr:hypothetical protein [Kitasatospora sp. SUK 42]MBV2154045.1 hypothetical protein [Kitasatospora sp. SUK 42]
MRANHATRPQEPAPRGVAGARRALARWLPHPRAVAVGGALLAQLWGAGAPVAYAATADPPAQQARPVVRRTSPGVTALDGRSAVRPAEPGNPADGEPTRSPGPVGEPTGGGPVDGDLRQRIRAGGLPLPGQRAAVPDAFAIASGLLDTAPAQDRAETHDSREDAPTGLPAAPRPRLRSLDPGPDPSSATTARPEEAEDPPVQEATALDGRSTPETADAAGAVETAAAPATPTGDGTPETLALADTATVTAVNDGSATATAVIAPIVAGLLLTGAAMCKHRGLPRGH